MVQLSQIYAVSKLQQNPAVAVCTSDAARNDELCLAMFSLKRDIFRLAAALSVVTPLELAFVIVAKLLVLHRLQRLAISRSLRRSTWDLLARLFLAIVIAVNVIGFVSNLASAVHYSQANAYGGQAVTAWAANETALGNGYELQASKSFETAAKTSAIQRFCELLLLLMIITVFLIVGANSSSVIASVLRTFFIARQKLSPAPDATELAAADKQVASVQGLVAAATEQGKQLQRQVVFTVLFVFLTVLVRSFFSVLYALAQALQDNANPCSRGNPCHPCHNVYSNIHFWILYSPVFQPLVMAIASPLALLVALWGMSDARALEQMTTAKAGLKLQWRAWRQKRQHKQRLPSQLQPL
jgi:hypothetical protein